MASPTAPTTRLRGIITYRFLMTFILGFLGALVFAGAVLAIQDPKIITGSAAFDPTGYIRGISAEGYYHLLVVMLVVSAVAFVGGATIAALIITVNASWYRRGIGGTNRLYSFVDAFAAAIFVGFTASLFLLLLPVAEVVAYGLISTLTIIFGLVVYLALWARRQPRELISALDLNSLLQELQTIDLDTSVLEPMVEGVQAPLQAGKVAGQSKAGQQARTTAPVAAPMGQVPSVAFQSKAALSGSVWSDLALAAIPGFFGFMGLAQLREGRRTRGLTFFVFGVLLGALSSWYLILVARIGEVFSSHSMPSAASLSWISAVFGPAGTNGWFLVPLLAAFLGLWIFQLYDATRANALRSKK